MPPETNADAAPVDPARGEHPPPESAPRSRAVLRELLARTVAGIQAANSGGVPF